MYVKRVLPNGVRIISERLDNVRTVSVGIWVGNGSRYEPAELNGISHFIEHMIFKGTEKRSARHIAIAIDALGGQANAFTDKECTCYYMKVLDSRLQTGIALLADMFLESRFAQEDIELERGVVLEEIDMYEDSPEDVAIDKLFEKCYDGSALGRPILGTEETLAPITTEIMHKYMHEYYRPEDTVIAVSGHFTDEDLDYIADLFSVMTGSGRNQTTPAIYKPSLVLRSKEIEQNHLCLSFPGVSALSEDRFTMNLLCNILGGGMSSRLFQEIREKRGLVYTINSFNQALKHAGVFGIYAGTTPKELEELLPVVADEIKKMMNDKVSETELKRAKTQIKASLLMSLESSSTTAEIMARQMLLFKRVIPTAEIVERIEAITADDLQLLAQKIFTSTPTYALLGCEGGTYPSYDDVKALLK